MEKRLAGLVQIREIVCKNMDSIIQASKASKSNTLERLGGKPRGFL